MGTMDKKLFYTPKEVAQLLGMSRSAIYHWIRAGKLRAVRIVGSVRVSKDALVDFVRTYSGPWQPGRRVAREPKEAGANGRRKTVLA